MAVDVLGVSNDISCDGRILSSLPGLVYSSKGEVAVLTDLSTTVEGIHLRRSIACTFERHCVTVLDVQRALLAS